MNIFSVQCVKTFYLYIQVPNLQMIYLQTVHLTVAFSYLWEGFIHNEIFSIYVLTFCFWFSIYFIKFKVFEKEIDKPYWKRSYTNILTPINCESCIISIYKFFSDIAT